MSITIFSFIMAILCCDIFTVIIFILLKKENFIKYFSMYSILFLLLLSFCRLFFNLEFSFATVIHSDTIFPTITDFFLSKPFHSITLTVGDIFLVFWIAGSIYFLYRILKQELKFKRLMSQETLTDDERINPIMSKIDTKYSKKLCIIKTSLVSSPMITGYMKPIIYLPELEFTDSELYYILFHEWSHYIHKDTWLKLFINITCSIYWWNPLIYLLRYNLNQILEIKSDLYISKYLTEEEKLEYLESIVKVAKWINEKTPYVNTASSGVELVPVHKGHTLKQRFKCILESSSESRKTAMPLFYAFLLLLFVISYLFVIQPYKGRPSDYDSNTMFDITPETSYLIKNDDGTYKWYMDGEYIYTLDSNDISEPPFSEMTIK